MAELFLERSRYYLTYEYPTKLRAALSGLPDHDVWHRENEGSNSIGNLLLHLAGNVRQWIVGGLGGQPVDRDRASEFSRREGPGAEGLLLSLDTVLREADAVLSGLNAPDLDRAFTIQGRQTTGLAAIYHVVEHFAMHTGQIIVLVKHKAPERVRFYDDAGGIAIPLWGGAEGMGTREEVSDSRKQIESLLLP